MNGETVDLRLAHMVAGMKLSGCSTEDLVRVTTIAVYGEKEYKKAIVNKCGRRKK